MQPGRPHDSAVRIAARQLLRSTSNLLKLDPAAVEALAVRDPELLAQWKQDLRALYDLVQEIGHAG